MNVQIVLFEDEQVPQLFPITLGQPAYAILCGSFRLIDWIEKLESNPWGLVRDYLQNLQTADYPDIDPVTNCATEKMMLWVNARMVPSVKAYRAIRTLRDRGEPCVVRSDSTIAVVMFPASQPPSLESVNVATMAQYFRTLGIDDLPAAKIDLPLLEYPHDLIYHNQQTLTENLEYRLKKGNYQELADGVFAADNAKVSNYFVSDTRHGPILLENRARVGPFAYISGPVHIGARTRVIEHAAIKDFVTIGHTAKIGGEVEASVVEAYTNKQHHGFIGHSYLGSWINLGAGTCNSDLKNTYGEVKMQYRDEKVSTGMQFIGCIMGDYAKSAINTGIFTGKTIGVCSMLYGFVTTNVPSFVNYARLFGQVTELPPDVMISTQRRTFQRRKVKQRDV